jgi:steroid 5-alpha reductase family enzyme
MFLLLCILSFSYILLFLLSLYLKDNSIADIFWGFGFVIIVWTSFLQSSMTLSQVLVTILVTAWGLRLVLTIGSKKLLHAGEDKRYTIWRQTWKYFKLRSFVQVYFLQMILMLLVATGILILNLRSGFEDSVILSILGSGIALFGLLYETIADSELRIFMQKKSS